MNCFTFVSLLWFLVARFVVLVRCVNEDFEVVLLPMEWSSSGNATVPLRFTAFGRNVDLLLEKNENLIAPNFEIWKNGEDNILRRMNDYDESASCHYLHKNSFSSAAVSLCDTGTVHGFVFLENDSLEITPLRKISKKQRIKVRSSSASGEPHVIKRRRIFPYQQSQVLDVKRLKASPRFEHESSSSSREKDKEEIEIASPLTIELAVFFDQRAYEIFQPHFSKNDEKLLDMILAYINNIQALYYHPSLGIRIKIALVRLELFQKQPEELAKLDGERSELLDTFCEYSKNQNPPDDEDPRHWDIGLYISGLDFYAVEDGKKNNVTMGLAPVGGVCWDEYSCVIAEFGVTNRLGKPYPSAGFTSVYIAAHELAHNLGMHHDSTGNDCPKDGYIMSPSRGTQGEAQWSTCSREKALLLPATKKCLLDRSDIDYQLEAHLDHSGKYSEAPGRHWSAKSQCEILLRDREAVVDDLKDCCHALKCKTPNRKGFYLAGPALDGTECESGKECRAGECLSIDDEWIPLPTIPTSSPLPSGWSEWREDSCQSGCIRGSLGHQDRRRICLGESTCPGLTFDVTLCKDNQLCEQAKPPRKRVTIEEFAGQRCRQFADRLEMIDGAAGGLQAEHEADRAWIACAIFCVRKDIASFYTPKMELNDLGEDPYFPDGTWCHKSQSGENYFCRRHQCLPENFRFGKNLPVEDDKLGLMNALPDTWSPPAELINYFSLDLNGKPLSTRIESHYLEPPSDDVWLDPKDYVELLPSAFEQTATRRSNVDKISAISPRFIM